MDRRQQGFSLIELMVVIAIIAIVGAIAIPRIIGLQKGAQMSAAVADLRAISSAEETYRKSQFQYGNIAALVAQKMIDQAWRNDMIRNGYKFTEIAVAGSYMVKAVAFTADGSATNPDPDLKSFVLLDGNIYKGATTHVNANVTSEATVISSCAASPPTLVAVAQQ